MREEQTKFASNAVEIKLLDAELDALLLRSKRREFSSLL